MCSAELDEMIDVELDAMVISSPSSIHATPRATTSRVWNRDQRSRSIRAGTRLVVPEGVVLVSCSSVVMSLTSPKPPIPKGRSGQIDGRRGLRPSQAFRYAANPEATTAVDLS